MKRSSNISGPDSSIENLSKLISSKAISPVDLIEYTFQQIHKLNPTLNAFITVLEDSARKEAKEAESLINQGKYKGPLHGIPVSLKDLIFVKGVRSTSGSKILADYVPDHDSTVVKKLKPLEQSLLVRIILMNLLVGLLTSTLITGLQRTHGISIGCQAVQVVVRQ